MAVSVEVQQIAFIIILIISFALLITERVRNDLVALLIVVSLAITGVLTTEEALAGFSSEPAIIVVAIFVLSGAMQQTGVSQSVGNWIARYAGETYDRAVAVIMPFIAVLSAFTHHVATTAFMVPVIMEYSQKRNIAPSKLLMPMAFAASLGTTITIVGAPAFLIASSVLQQQGESALGIFSIAPIGITLTIVGTVFMLTIGRVLLPTRQGSKNITEQIRLDRYFTELTILADSRLIGLTLEEVKAVRQYEFTVVGWIRDNHRLTGPFNEPHLQAEDVLLVHTTPEGLATFNEDEGVALHPVEKFKDHLDELVEKEETETHLVQAVVAPRSEMIGQSLRSIDFRRRYGALVVAFWRRRNFVQRELSRIKLRAGDVLVLQGDEDALSRVARDPAFLMLVPFSGEAHKRRRARTAALIVVATMIVAILNVISLEIVMLTGAIMMVLAGCVTPAQAYRSIDARIFIFIAGAIPLGTAMEKTGVSDAVAIWLQQVLGGLPQVAILLIIFWVVAILTQFMSDAATTALFAPLAAALAIALGHSPTAYVVTVAMASVASFLTPIGHHGNLLIYGLGGYRFNDFLKVGTPLTLLVSLVVVILSPMLWA